MGNIQSVRLQAVSLQKHPKLTEAWVQEQIAQDPTVLGLGELQLIDRERRQPRAGRLDLLLVDPESARRYTVELQLGSVDESHVIRTIEYWDLERKRYPNRDHCAVLVAEEVTSRFLNVLSLLNGTIPLIVLQMKAYQVTNDGVALVFTRVLDETIRGIPEDEEAAEAAPTTREDWETRSSKAIMELVDQFFSLAQEVTGASLTPKYNKYYVGVVHEDRSRLFFLLRPLRKALTIKFKIPESAELSAKIEESGVNMLPYEHQWGQYRIQITRQELRTQEALLRELIGLAWKATT